MFVHPDFHKAVKMNACQEGMKIVDYTRVMAENLKDLGERKVEIDKKIKKPRYLFRF